MIYTDTSALLKRYLHEAFSEEFDAFFLSRGPLAISRLNLVEARCSLARRRRGGLIDSDVENGAWRELHNDIHDAALRLHMIADEQVAEASRLIESLPGIALRSLNAIHLAIAREIQATAFATADRIQAEAAEALGLTVHRFY
ncbi:MAG: type II toxin-antitoxin system VapC family toxin [Rhodocyclaceae bacterium]|nr:type II toxin-antitoxin system VapC family toxin [Rhodocyclaceae bacterium]